MYRKPGEKLLLIVEDDPFISDLLVDIIETEAGCTTQLATTGRRAIEFLASTQPDLVLLDLRLPDMNGIEVYDVMHASVGTRNIPVLFITANSDDPRLVQRGLQNNVVAKPFIIEDLLIRLDAILGVPIQPPVVTWRPLHAYA